MSDNNPVTPHSYACREGMVLLNGIELSPMQIVKLLESQRIQLRNMDSLAYKIKRYLEWCRYMPLNDGNYLLSKINHWEQGEE